MTRSDRLRTDPRYEEEVSGCTASTAIISKHKIWVVSGHRQCSEKGFRMANLTIGERR